VQRRVANHSQAQLAGDVTRQGSAIPWAVRSVTDDKTGHTLRRRHHLLLLVINVLLYSVLSALMPPIMLWVSL
jgi:hypothetical protein